MSDPAKWTILTYIAAHNDLQLMGERSLGQIIDAGSTPDVMHGVLFDGIDGAKRYVVGDGGRAIQEEPLGEFNAADPARLVETAQWLFSHYPAEHYGLILWSHGTGWEPLEIDRAYREIHADEPPADEGTVRAVMPGSRALFRTSLTELVRPERPIDRAILFDDGSSQALDTIQLGQVANEISNGIGQQLDLLGMDACLMATIEVAHQLRETVSHLVASEDLVPGLSWPYDRILTRLHANPDMSTRDLADCVVAEYAGYYRERPPGPKDGEVTKIALDLSRLDRVTPAMKHLADALIADMPAAISCLERAQTSTYLRETNDVQREITRFEYHLWDIVSMARELAEDCDSPTVSAAARQLLSAIRASELVVRSEHVGAWLEGIGGMSVYWIAPREDEPRHISPFYRDVTFAQDAGWQTMLEAYRYPSSW